ncbi:unnamed protein product [Closterium sp. Naga37s-1]|nr:unnamed protein product [Closterium sp. Naga37s-1]
MRHGEEQGQHRHSHLPLIVPEGSWKEVYRGLVELDREWKVPPQLPLQAVGSSSEEEGWGAEWTLRDDFFWFSQPFPQLQEARESLTFRLDLPLCLITGVEIVSGQDIWNAVCPNFLQVTVARSHCPVPPSLHRPPLTPPHSPCHLPAHKSKWGSPPPPSPSPPPPSPCPPPPSPTCSASPPPRSPWATMCACCSQAPPGGEAGRKAEGSCGGTAKGRAMKGAGGKGVPEGGVRGGGRVARGKVHVKLPAVVAASVELNAPPPPPRFCIERVRVFGIPLGALPPQNTLQAALVQYAVGRDGGELDAVMRSAVGRGVRALGSVEGVVRALGENLVDAFASDE